MTKYELGSSGETISIEPSVLDYFKQYQQNARNSCEAGGPLFTIRGEKEHKIVLACGPFPKDTRRRSAFIPHRPSTQECIDIQHALGRHFIGSWHTHPQRNPTPSPIDICTMATLFARSKHNLNAFIYIIVGTGDLPQNLFVCAWSDKGRINLRMRTSETLG